jgi:hypothetical protein
MATEDDIRGLPKHEWRVKDGEAQRRVELKLDVDYTTPENQDVPALAEKLREFAEGHDEPQADIDHKYEDHPDYSCELWLRLRGWKTVSDEEVRSARQRARALLKTRERELERALAAQREHAEREMARVRAELGEDK